MYVYIYIYWVSTPKRLETIRWHIRPNTRLNIVRVIIICVKSKKYV